MRHLWRWGAALMVAAAGCVASASGASFNPQSTQSARGVISGRTVDGTSNQPMPGMTISAYEVPDSPTVFPLDNTGHLIVTGTGQIFGLLLTDADGRFRIGGLPDGCYELQAYGMMGSGAFGQTGPSDPLQCVEVAAGKPVNGITVRIWRNPILGGRVIDEAGRPVVGVDVVAVPLGDITQRYSATTDDRGVYEICPPPGKYRVAAWPPPSIRRSDALPSPRPDGRPTVYPLTFYPGTDSFRSADEIAAAAGSQRTGLDIRLAPVRAFRILGRNAPVSVERHAYVTLVRDDPFGESAPHAVAGEQINSGQFTMDGVPAGDYRLRVLFGPQMPNVTHGVAALRSLPQEPTLWADVPITVVDRDVSVDIDLRTGVRLSGSVTFEGRPPPAAEDLTRTAIVLERIGDPDADLRGLYLSPAAFTTIQVPPGQYLLRPLITQGWYLKSILAGGRDVTDAPIDIGTADRRDIEITFTSRPSIVRGTVQQATPQATSRSWVTLFPVDRALWTTGSRTPVRLAMIQTNRRGVFEALLPPGTYFIAATDRRVSVPADFARLALVAETVTLNDGAPVIQNLRLQRLLSGRQ